MNAMCSGASALAGSSASTSVVGMTSRNVMPPIFPRLTTLSAPALSETSSLAIGSRSSNVVIVRPRTVRRSVGSPLPTAVVPAGTLKRSV